MSKQECRTCKHWEKPEDRTGFGNAVSYQDDEWDYDLDDYARGGVDDKLFGTCLKIPLGAYLSSDEPAPLAVTLDASSYRSTVFTQAEFGCVLWEVTDGTAPSSEGGGRETP
jgi:hypothetical protein